MTAYSYDNNGNLTAVQSPGVNGLSVLTTDYVFNNLGRKVKAIQPDPATGQTDLIGTTDPNCPKSYVGYDASGNLVSTTDPNGNTTSYLYNLAGRQTQAIDALGDTTTTLYDAVGNVLGVTDPLGNTTRYQYDTMNRKIAQISPLPGSADAQASGSPLPYSGKGQGVRAISVPGFGAVVCRRPHHNLVLRPQRQRHGRHRSAGQYDLDAV